VGRSFAEAFLAMAARWRRELKLCLDTPESAFGDVLPVDSVLGMGLTGGFVLRSPMGIRGEKGSRKA
jgi:hypothetical protein